MSNINEELTKELMMASRFLRHRQGRPRGQENILKVLATKGEISQRDLQEELGIRAGSISEIISKLEFRGFVSRKRCDEDARAMKITLTEKGQEIADKLDDSLDENLYSSISEEEKNQLKDILVKLNNDWIRREPIHEPHFPEFGCLGHHCHKETMEGPHHRGPRPPMPEMDRGDFPRRHDEEEMQGFPHGGPRQPMMSRGQRPPMPEMDRGDFPRSHKDERGHRPFDPHFEGSDENNHFLGRHKFDDEHEI